MSAPTERSNGFAMAVAVEGGLALLALALAWVFGVHLREQFAPWGKPMLYAIARGLIATLPMLLIFWLLVNSEWRPLRELRDQVEWLVREMFPDASLGQFAMVAALAGVGEELLFRGVLQTKLGMWTTPVVGLLLASILFGLAHALSKLYFAFAIAVGIYLGWLAVQYQDLTAPIITHALYDFLALAYLSRRAMQQPAESATRPRLSPEHEPANDE
jgi:membrane protease YdiL (CAAX protease family)